MSIIMPPKAVLFDFDNTLVDTWPKLHKVMNETFTEFGLPTWTIEKVKERAHHSSKDAFPVLFGDNHQKAREFFYSLYRQKYAHEKLPQLPHAQNMLESVRSKGIKTGIVSNKEGITLRKEIKEMGWDVYFDCLVGSLDASKDKPHPEPVYLALEKLNLDKGEHIWFVGDSLVDIQCAHNSSCMPVLYGDKAAAPNIEQLGIPHKHVKCHSTFSDLLLENTIEAR